MFNNKKHKTKVTFALIAVISIVLGILIISKWFKKNANHAQSESHLSYFKLMDENYGNMKDYSETFRLIYKDNDLRNSLLNKKIVIIESNSKRNVRSLKGLIQEALSNQRNQEKVDVAEFPEKIKSIYKDVTSGELTKNQILTWNIINHIISSFTLYSPNHIFPEFIKDNEGTICVIVSNQNFLAFLRHHLFMHLVQNNKLQEFIGFISFEGSFANVLYTKSDFKRKVEGKKLTELTNKEQEMLNEIDFYYLSDIVSLSQAGSVLKDGQFAENKKIFFLKENKEYPVWPSAH